MKTHYNVPIIELENHLLIGKKIISKFVWNTKGNYHTKMIGSIVYIKIYELVPISNIILYKKIKEEKVRLYINLKLNKKYSYPHDYYARHNREYFIY